MRKVSIVASHPTKRKIMSEVIKYFLDTEYSHVNWVFWSRDYTTPFYYEAALLGGVSFVGKRYWESRHQIVFIKTFAVTDEVYDKFLYEAMSRCGAKYSLLQNIGIQVSKWLKLTKNLFSNGDDGSNCSELIFIFKSMVGLEISEDQDLVTPKQIVEACKLL